MPWVVPVAIAGAAVIGGAISAISSASDRNAAQQAALDAMNEIQSVGAPPNLAQQIFLKHFQSAGVLTPQLQQAVQQQASSLSAYSGNQQALQAQQNALSTLAQQGQVGFSPQDRAAFNQVNNQVAQNQQAKIQQIMDSMRARGMGGSGAELAASLNAADQGQQMAAQQGDQLAGLSSQRALEAMVASGQLGGQMESQRFAEASQKAAAQDAINRFNSMNAQSVQGQNVNAQNAANQYNLMNQQQLMNANTQMDNSEQMRQLMAQEQNWQDRMAQAQAMANAQLGKAGVYQNAANQTAGMWQGMGQGLSQGVAAGYGYMNQQDQLASQQANQAAWQNLYSQANGLNGGGGGSGGPSLGVDTNLGYGGGNMLGFPNFGSGGNYASND